MSDEIKFSYVESKRFGVNILRGLVNEVNPEKIRSQLIKNQADITFLRIPSSVEDQGKLLSQIGFDFIHAGTLIKYSIDLVDYNAGNPEDNQLQIRKASYKDAEVLSTLVRDIFKDYRNHYLANSLLAENYSSEGYSEWALSFLKDINKDVFIVSIQSIDVAFATINPESEAVNIALNGVLPKYSGRGVYTYLLRFILDYYKEKNKVSLDIATQIENLTVQRVWNTVGLKEKEIFNTYHIISLLDFSTEPKKEIVYNDVIESEPMLNWILEEVVLKDFIKRGVKIMSHKNLILKHKFLSPFYKFILSVLSMNDKEYLSCVIKAKDENDKLVLISYIQLGKNENPF